MPVPWGTREPPNARKTLLDSPPLLVSLARGRRASGLDERRTSPLEAGRVSAYYIITPPAKLAPFCHCCRRRYGCHQGTTLRHLPPANDQEKYRCYDP